MKKIHELSVIIKMVSSKDDTTDNHTRKELTWKHDESIDEFCKRVDGGIFSMLATQLRNHSSKKPVVMSLYAYCQKQSDAEQKYHCSIKCFACIIEIGKTRAIWEYKLKNKEENEKINRVQRSKSNDQSNRKIP